MENIDQAKKILEGKKELPGWPVSKFKEDADQAWEEYDREEKEIKDLARAAYDQEYETEAEKRELKSKRELAQEKSRTAEYDTVQLIKKCLDCIFKGDHGQGQLAVLTGYSIKGYELIRVMPLTKNSSRIKELAKNVYVKDYEIVGREMQNKSWVSHNIQTDNHLAEVDKKLTTHQDLDNFMPQLINSMNLTNILTLLPSDYNPTFKPGESLDYDSGKHGGDLDDGQLVYLPSGGFAILDRSRGDDYSWGGNYSFEGIAKDISTNDPDWKTKWLNWKQNESNLVPPSEEEKKFLLDQKKYDLDKDDFEI